jgi:hypothetical protein
MEYTCSLLNIKLTEIFKVKFCTNYENLIHLFPNFRKMSTSHTPTYSNVHTHTHTIYLLFHIQFSVLLVALINFHTHNYSCIVTTTRHAVLFHVWHLLMFYSMLHFLHPYISVHPCCTSAPVHPIPVHTHR